MNKRRWGTIPKFQVNDDDRHDSCVLPFGHDSAHVVHHKNQLLCFSDLGGVVGDTAQAKATIDKQRAKSA